MIVPRLRDGFRHLRSLEDRCNKIQEALGRIETRQLHQSAPTCLQDAEFRVFSQWGEDGILQHLTRTVDVGRNIFVEFGVENYTEANTRFLLVNNGWSGLVIDGSPENIAYIRNDAIYWRHNLKAQCAFIERENINQLIRDNGISGRIGLLSVDIDGNDYWVWKAIDQIDPSIVVAEYNARFGPSRPVTVPYDPAFVRTKAHYSNIYYGASLAALCLLAKQKGYSFVGCNSAGVNAFFVKTELMPSTLRELTPEEGFVMLQFRESRNSDGSLAHLSSQQEAAILDTLPLVDVSGV